MDLKTDDLSEQFFEKLHTMLTSDEAANPADADPEFWSRGLSNAEVETFDFVTHCMLGATVAMLARAQGKDEMDHMEWMFISSGMMDREFCYMCHVLSLMIEEVGASESDYDFDESRSEIEDETSLENFDAMCNILEQFADMYGATASHVYTMFDERVQKMLKEMKSA